METPDKLFVHTGRLGFLCASKINITGNGTEYIRKDLVEHIIRGALGPQDVLNKIRSL